MNPVRSLCTWSDAFDVVTTEFSALPAVVIPIKEANGLVAVEALPALNDLPAYASSAMDGWAVCGSGPWRVRGEVATGRQSSTELTDSECLKISTGGVIPIGCTAVIPWEDVTVNDDVVTGTVELGANIRPAATEAAKGEVLLDAGTRLTPTFLGLLAASGYDTVPVITRPRVTVILLGDELVQTGLPKDGKIRDALGVQLPSFLASCNADIVTADFITDDTEVIVAAFESAFRSSDFVISTGGTADGPKDFAKFVIEHFGMEFLVDRVRMRPGYHFLLAAASHAGRRIPYIALPGNPQSAIAALSSFGIPLLARLGGAAPASLTEVKLGVELTTPRDFARLVPGRILDGAFMPSGYLGSAMLRGLAASDGFALVAPGLNPSGATAHWIPLPFLSPRG